jgi:hypothetical protein
VGIINAATGEVAGVRIILGTVSTMRAMLSLCGLWPPLGVGMTQQRVR